MSEMFSVREDEVKEVGTKIVQLGESLGYSPAHFCLILGLIHQWLAEELGIKVHQIKVRDEALN